MADLLAKCVIIHYAVGLSLHCVLTSVLVSINAENIVYVCLSNKVWFYLKDPPEEINHIITSECI